MQKILSGLLGVIAIVGVVSGSAYALFTTQATVDGLNLTAATPGLWVGLGSAEPLDDSETANVTGALIPGQEFTADFRLKNSSDNNLGLDITAKLTAATGSDWGILKDVVEAYVVNDTTGTNTPWKTLAEWNTAGVDLTGGTLPVGTTWDYTVHYRLMHDADNSYIGKSLTNITFVFTGSQHE